MEKSFVRRYRQRQNNQNQRDPFVNIPLRTCESTRLRQILFQHLLAMPDASCVHLLS